MTLVDPVALLRDAAAAGTGVGAFNVIQLEHAEALVAAAESVGVPVVLQVSQNAVRYHRALEPLLGATLAVARASSAPVVVHLDHAEDRDLVAEAVRLGAGSVMYDGSRLAYDANVAATASVVAMCHAAGVAVEADSLAVAVGTSHAMTSPGAVVDLELVRALRAVVPVPLVLHGSSGLDDEGLRAVVAAGITKVNVGTRLNVAMTRAVRAALDGDPKLVDPRRYLAPARDAIRIEAATVLSHLAG